MDCVLGDVVVPTEYDFEDAIENKEQVNPFFLPLPHEEKRLWKTSVRLENPFPRQYIFKVEATYSQDPRDVLIKWWSVIRLWMGIVSTTLTLESPDGLRFHFTRELLTKNDYESYFSYVGKGNSSNRE